MKARQKERRQLFVLTAEEKRTLSFVLIAFLLASPQNITGQNIRSRRPNSRFTRLRKCRLPVKNAPAKQRKVAR